MEESMPIPAMIFAAIILTFVLAVTATIIAFVNPNNKNDYVVIFYEGIHICGYVEKARLHNDVWEITLRGGAKYKAPREIVIFCPDPFTSQNVSSQEGTDE